MDSPLVIDYYSDILCVWAWISQRRLEEVRQQWAEKVQLRHMYLNLFGDTQARTRDQWGDRGGYAAYGDHVRKSAAPFDNAPVHPDVWSKVRPATSANAHLVIKAAALTNSVDVAENLAVSIRRAFFVEAVDVGQLGNLFRIATLAGLDEGAMKKTIDDGSAAAALMHDYQQAHLLQISGSPTWIMNAGRQRLYGNIGYRVLHANIQGLLAHRGDSASWC